MRVLMGVSAGLAVVMGISLATLIPLFLVMGPEHALVGGGLEFGTAWIGISLSVYLVAAGIGGWVAHRVSGSRAAVLGLVAMILLFGFLDAGYHQWWVTDGPVLRAQLSGLELLLGLREPLWFDLMGPLLMGTFAWVAGMGRDFEFRQGTGTS